MSQLAIYLLGPPRVELDGEALHIPRRKAVALLVYLAAERRPHSRDSLAALLWPEYDQSGARGRLRRTLSSLNRNLGEGYLDADRETVSLCETANYWLDVDAFRQSLLACEKHGHPRDAACVECQARLEEAVALYRDDFLAGFSLPDSLAFDEWARYQSESLRDELAGALERLAEILAAQGQYEEATPHARRWLSLDPLREAAHRCLMRLYALSDQEPAALRQYHECQRTLKEELGVPPSLQTVELMERIQTLRVSETLRVSVAHNLPPQPTRFVGREKELEQLGDLIADPDMRLITTVGPGGIGKTRLALEAAKRQLNSAEPLFPDGVFFVSLARMSPSDEMAPAVAEALNFRLGGPEESRLGESEESRSARQQVLDYLRKKQMLLVLDPFEHLLSSPSSVSPIGGETAAFPPSGGDARRAGGESGGVGFVADVLCTAPKVQLLVTSRERLRLREEQAFQTSGLDHPGAEPGEVSSEPDDVLEYASARLFLQAARRVQSGFELASDDAPALFRICRQLEGMPLAIELAATWVDVLPLADIGSEIQRGIDFLATEWQDAPERHRSVRAAFDASWRRLTEAERAVFAQLCVFRGGFTREAAKGVMGADLRTLARLASKSLLRLNRPNGRYEVHELLRQYGSDRLATDPELEHGARDRHNAYYCDALARWGDAMNRGKQTEAAIDLEADWANLRTAFEWAAEKGDVSRLDLALDGLWHVIAGLGRDADGEMLYQRAVDGLAEEIGLRDADAKRVLAKAYLLRCTCSYVLAHRDLHRSGLYRSKALLEDPAIGAADTRAERAWLHIVLAQQAMPDWESARRHIRRALALQRALGYHGQVAYRILYSARMDYQMVKRARGIRDAEAALRMFRAMGNQIGALNALFVLGFLMKDSGNLSQAAGRYQEGFAVASELGSAFFQARTLVEIGICAMLQGHYEKAEMLLLDSCQIAHRCGDVDARCQAVQLLGETAWYQGDVDGAERRWNELLVMASEPRLPSYDIMAHRWLSYTACARGEFDRAETLCMKALSTAAEDDRFVRGMVTLGLARVMFFRGHISRPIELFRKCLQLLKRTRDAQDQIRSLEGLSWVLADANRYEDTAELLGFLAAERKRTGMILPPVDQPHHERALGLAREGLGEEAFTSAWTVGAALTLEQTVDFALQV